MIWFILSLLFCYRHLCKTVTLNWLVTSEKRLPVLWDKIPKSTLFWAVGNDDKMAKESPP